MKINKICSLIITVIALALTVSCATADTAATTVAVDEDRTIGFAIQYDVKQVNEETLKSMLLDLNKATKRNPDLKSYSSELNTAKREAYTRGTETMAEMETRFSDTLATISESLGYKVVFPEVSRFVVEGDCVVRYGWTDKGVYAEYRVFVELVDNRNLPLDPSRNSSLISSHSELDNATDISTIEQYIPDTWSINGSVKGNDVDTVLSELQDIIDGSLAESFAVVL